MNNFCLVSLITLWLWVFNFCSAKCFAESSDAPNKATVRLANFPSSHDYNLHKANPIISGLIGAGLIQLDAVGKLKPGLVESWKVSGATIEFKLKRNIKFKSSPVDGSLASINGERICGHHFVLAIHRALTKKSVHVERLLGIKGVKEYLDHPGHQNPGLKLGLETALSRVKIQSSSCHTLKVEFSEVPQLDLFIDPITFPIPKESVDNLLNFSTGPYVVTEKIGAEKIILRKNEFWPKHSTLNLPREIVTWAISEDVAALTLYRTKQIDWLKDVAPQEIKAKQLPISVLPTDVTYHFGMSSAMPVHLRCLFSKLIDQSGVNSVLGGIHEPLSLGFFPNFLDPASKKTLQAWRNAVSLSDSEKKSLEDIPIVYYAKGAHRVMVDQIVENLKVRFKLDLKSQSIDPKVYWDMLAKSPPMIFLGGSTQAKSGPDSLYEEFTSTSFANWGKIKSSVVDSLVEKLRKVSNRLQIKPTQMLRQEREKLVSLLEVELQTKLCSVVPLYRRSTSIVDRYQFMKLNAKGQPDLGY